MGMLGKSGIALTALVLALTVLASCGGGADGSVSERQFLLRGGQICEQVFDEINAEYSSLSGEVAARPGSSEMDMNVGTQKFIVPAIEGLVRRLRALGAPEGEAGQLEKALASLEDGIERVAKDARAARGSLGVAFAFQDGYEKLWALGLRRCGGAG